MAATIKSEEQILRRFHPHPMYFGSYNLRSSKYCVICNKMGKGSDPYYYCSVCDEYQIHKSCLVSTLPQEIEHPIHAGHRLGRVDVPPLSMTCGSCVCYLNNQICFHCNECHFYLCFTCSHMAQLIRYKGHPYNLRFMENNNLLSDGRCCDAYECICKSSPLLEEFRLTQGYGFRSVGPGSYFNIHLLCGPLPCTIKHSSHVDCLTLEDSIIEDDDPDDEYYCNTCEELRDPRVRVYYCVECKFVAHVHCVISEVVSLLKGEHGVVDTRNLGARMTVKEMLQNEASENIAEKRENKRPWVREIINSLNEYEKEELVNCFEPQRWKIGNIVGTSIEDQETEDNEENFKVRLMNRPKWGNADPTKQWKFEEYEQKSVNIEGYTLPRELAPILKDLFVKYGDVSRESKLNHKVKSVLLSCLCWTVDKMRKTLVVEISEDVLILWWCNLKGMLYAGFKVEFIVDRLKKVSRSYFDLEAKKQANEMTAKLEAMTREVEAMSRKLKVVQQKVRSYPRMKWTFAGEGLL
ncbi:hypothetical protein CJ030_MR2G025680 [Morella rubra]|uniref:DC1 domain-containing protein n=1 Tax=Morella rubra TaxID=262757 RepID=A0A6A1WEW1_9ROSI|nr:hypothetical protein CJ030_MR8G020280 [Morella rubra]KAB1223393.1 hypothetical protein CJ030_MR2G025680 [Morella rubra]